jgi:hypothetical protein
MERITSCIENVSGAIIPIGMRGRFVYTSSKQILLLCLHFICCRVHMRQILPSEISTFPAITSHVYFHLSFEVVSCLDLYILLCLT